SYWNGSSVGKTPAEVTSTAEKLNAITNYLIARTNANQFEKSKVPNAVYDWLHTYDQYNPNNNADDANTINTKTHDIKAAINAANATTSAYQSALTTIASAENSFDKTNDQGQETLTADIVNAKAQLELATDENGINTALANIKKFDAFTFNPDVPSKIEEGNTLDNPASAQQGNVITYESSDNTIIEIDGTTLKALKPGTVTITATTKTGDKYYGYTTTKEFTVTPKALILYPGEKCTIVPNIVYPEITLERSFSAKTHYTLTLPFDSNISDIDGDYAAQLALVTYNKADGYTLYFQKVAEGDMIANQPYIVYAENGFKKSLKWVNITVAETIEAKGVSNDRTQGWTMQGNYTPGLSMSGKYGIAGGEFCLGTEKSSINAYTAYFTFLGTENVRTRVAVMDEGGNTTYIGELKDLDGNAAEEGIFGLDGIQQNQLRKGINIVRMKDGKVRKILK
ncbi:MAG: Ig-like domain-containing protein, partial [Bacteroidaceae bacterium]|nr:Ig-like domain-containing protein [Bacteroidaceae bacterium]